MFHRTNIVPLIALCLSSIAIDAFQISPDQRAIGGDLIWRHESTIRTRVTNSESSSSRRKELPPVIQQIADERAEFQINLGRAMDTLRRDMPEILSRTPDFGIYHEEISVIDPSGVQLKGLDKYKSAFAFLQTFQRFWFRDESGIQFRMVYDFCRSSIRISWHCMLIPKVPLGRPLHVDGISYYQLDVESGKIIEHKIETLIINNAPVTPPYGILSLLQQDALGMRPQGVPAHILGVTSLSVHNDYASTWR